MIAADKHRACKEQNWRKKTKSRSPYSHLWYQDGDRITTVCGVGHAAKEEELGSGGSSNKCTLCATSKASSTNRGDLGDEPTIDLQKKAKGVPENNNDRVKIEVLGLPEGDEIAPNDGLSRAVMQVDSLTGEAIATAVRNFMHYYGKPGYVVVSPGRTGMIRQALDSALLRDIKVYVLGGVLRNEIWMPLKQK